MKVYGIFHGGHSYSTYWTNRDVEQFDSIQQAKDTFWRRTDFDPYYPCTDETASMWLFFTDPRNQELAETDLIDPGYPDRILELGKRGGILVTRC